jgi:hypothetical protein
MITEEEERRMSAATAISTSAAAFRRHRRPSSEHLCCGALTLPDFKEEAIDMAYDLHGINPGRLCMLGHNPMVQKYHLMTVSLFLSRARTQRRVSAGRTTSFHVVPPQPLVLMSVFLFESKPQQSRELRLINISIS